MSYLPRWAESSITRPALSDERIQVNAAGQVELRLKTPWRDGTTQLVLSSLAFLQRLVALVPRPRLHLIRYHGVQAPNARLRARVVPQGPPAQAHVATGVAAHDELARFERRQAAAFAKANGELEGFVAPPDFEALTERYVAGDIGIEDMLAWLNERYPDQPASA